MTVLNGALCLLLNTEDGKQGISDQNNTQKRDSVNNNAPQKDWDKEFAPDTALATLQVMDASPTFWTGRIKMSRLFLTVR